MALKCEKCRGKNGVTKYCAKCRNAFCDEVKTIKVIIKEPEIFEIMPCCPDCGSNQIIHMKL